MAELASKKYRSLSDIIAATAPRVAVPVADSDDYDYGDVRCEECRFGECGGEMFLCDKCDRGFHICLRPIIIRVPTGPSSQKPSRKFRITQTKIVDFFRIQKPESSIEKSSIDTPKRRRRSGQLVVSKKKRRLLPFVPSAEPERRLKQMGSLAVALKALQMQFSDELTYVPGLVSRSANAAKLEKGGMQLYSRGRWTYKGHDTNYRQKLHLIVSLSALINVEILHGSSMESTIALWRVGKSRI